MPHIQIDYGAGLEATVDIQGLVDVVHQAAVDSGVFPLWGIRTFAQAVPCYRIGNGHPANAFVHISVRIAPGRSPEVRSPPVAAEQRKDPGEAGRRCGRAFSLLTFFWQDKRK